MLLTKSRLSIIIPGLIAIVVLLFLMAGQANAEDSVGGVTDAADFEDGLGIAAGTGWDWTGEGNVMKVAVFLDIAFNNIAEIEVFVEPTTLNTKPVFSQRPTAGGVFPTGVNFGFTLTVPATREITGQTALVDASTILPLDPGTTVVGIHLVDGNGNDIRRSAAPVNTGLVNLGDVAVSAPTTDEEEERPIAQPLSTPAPTPAPTATPGAEPPATGGVAPGSGALLAMMLVGFLLIVAGGAYLARPRGSRS